MESPFRAEIASVARIDGATRCASSDMGKAVRPSSSMPRQTSETT